MAEKIVPHLKQKVNSLHKISTKSPQFLRPEVGRNQHKPLTDIFLPFTDDLLPFTAVSLPFTV
jgi:hypothetical protein